MPKRFRTLRLNQFFLVVAAFVLLFQTLPDAAARPLAAPTLLSIAPAAGKQGQTVNVILQGTNFAQGNTAMDVAGTGVTASGVQVVNDTFMFAVLTIATSAASGDRNVTVTTPDGTSNAAVFTINAAAVPALTSLTPPNSNLGQALNVTLTGTNFVLNGTFVNVSGTGVGVSAVNVINATSLTATLTVATGAALGNRNVSVTTAGVTSGTIGFNVLGAPTVTAATAQLPAGSTLNVTLTGTNFTFGTTTVNVSGAGVTVNSVTNSTSTTTRTASVTVAPNAALGNREISVSTPAGTSAPLTLAVTPLGGYTISTIGGKGAIAEGGAATAQSLATVRDVARDTSGNLYIVAPGANKVYK